MQLIYSFIFLLMVFGQNINAQPPGPVPAAGANPPPPPPPPGRGFQLECSDQYAYLDVCDPNLFQQFSQNAPPGYRVVAVDSAVYSRKSAHRYLVKYQSHTFRRCEDIRRVHHDMSTFKPQNSNVGQICVIPGGFQVEYKQFCMCYRRGFRRRRSLGWWDSTKEKARNMTVEFFQYHLTPNTDSAGNVVRCDDHDQTCGRQKF